MRFAPITLATSLATTSIAAPNPRNNIIIDCLIGVSAVIPRCAVPDEDLAVNPAGSFVHAKRDLISDTEGEIRKLRDKSLALTEAEAAFKRDAAPGETAGMLRRQLRA